MCGVCKSNLEISVDWWASEVYKLVNKRTLLSTSSVEVATSSVVYPKSMHQTLFFFPLDLR